MSRRLPPGIDVQTLARSRNRNGQPEAAPAASPALAPAAPRKMSPEELRQRMVHASLSVENPPDNSAALVDAESQMTLAVMEIEPYDRNPRHTRNALFVMGSFRKSLKVRKRSFCGICTNAQVPSDFLDSLCRQSG